MPNAQVSTHIFKVVDGLSLSIDVSKPPSAPQDGIVLLHFHGEFLVHLLNFSISRERLTHIQPDFRRENHFPTTLVDQRLPRPRLDLCYPILPPLARINGSGYSLRHA